MNIEIFSEWLCRQGYRVSCTDSTYWYEAGPRVYQAFPFHWAIQPSNAELTTFLVKKRALALRYSTPIQSDYGCISYHMMYEEKDYTLDSLDRRTRQNVRKGLKNCEIKLLSCECLACDGWHLEADTIDRQGRQGNLCRDTWHDRCMALAELPGFEIWGAIVDGRLAASLLTFQMEDCCEMISQQCHRDFLRARVNNALTYTVTQTMIRRPDVQKIFYSLHSLDAPDSVDIYKFRMGYRAKPIRQRVVFHPLLKRLANGLSHKIILMLLQGNSSSHFLSKAEGLLRFYLQGKCSLENQSWPKCLEDIKVKLLEGGEKKYEETYEN